MKLFKKAFYEKLLGIGNDPISTCQHETYDIVFSADAVADPDKVCRYCSKDLGKVSREDALRYWNNFNQS